MYDGVLQTMDAQLIVSRLASLRIGHTAMPPGLFDRLLCRREIPQAGIRYNGEEDWKSLDRTTVL